MKNIFFIYLFPILLFFFGSTSVHAQYIQVDTSNTPDQLLQKFIGTSNSGCISVSNVQITGWDFGSGNKSYGYFSKGSSSFEINDGIILSTGSALAAVGPNSYIQTERYDSEFAESHWPGDQDLENILVEAGLPHKYILNATVLEFDFVSTYSDKIRFDYMFLSEEYRKSNCQYSDAFAFLIKEAGTSDPYQNIALVPGTTIPVSSLSINGAPNCESNIEYFGGFNPEETPTNFNGETKTLPAVANVIPGKKYHIKLVISDEGDSTGLFDSAVFLKAGSFQGSKDIGGDRLISLGNAVCENSKIILNAFMSGASSYQWYKDGNPVSGANASTYTVSEAGFYEVVITVSGCTITGSAKIEYVEDPVFNNSFNNVVLPCAKNPNEVVVYHLPDLIPNALVNYQDYFDITFFDSDGNLLEDDFPVTGDTSVFMHVKSGSCPTKIKEIKLLYKSPRKSVLLEAFNQTTICPEEKLTLEAEKDFVHYKWMKDGIVFAEGDHWYSVEIVGPGDYSVELQSANGCLFLQEIVILKSEEPVITHIDVSGSTATVYAAGGTTPYLYSIDSLDYQSSNVFYNVPRGVHTAYVKSADGCYIIEKEFLIVNLINVITPNGDGYNDVLDYSDLKMKNNVLIEIFDRFGQKVFRSESQNYIWDGKISGRAVPTGTYWYILNWEEPDTGLQTSYKGWILVKNRN